MLFNNLDEMKRLTYETPPMNGQVHPQDRNLLRQIDNRKWNLVEGILSQQIHKERSNISYSGIAPIQFMNFTLFNKERLFVSYMNLMDCLCEAETGETTAPEKPSSLRRVLCI